MARIRQIKKDARLDRERLMSGSRIKKSADATYVKKQDEKKSKSEINKDILQKIAASSMKKRPTTVSSRSSTPDKVRKEILERRDKEKLASKIMKAADVATDIMQAGNFIPNPAAQAIGKVGNVLGGSLDAYQAYDEYDKGNLDEASINALSLALSTMAGGNAFRRNSKYLKPGQVMYKFSPQAAGNFSSRTRYIEPFNKVKGMTNRNLLANRALLGLLAGETAYDVTQ